LTKHLIQGTIGRELSTPLPPPGPFHFLSTGASTNPSPAYALIKYFALRFFSITYELQIL